jgi:predicted DsbA family dithiol-disulfide isomerase
MQIDIISDTVCPWCFIGKRRLERALAARPDIPFDVRWRAYRLDPTIPRGGVDRKAYMRAKFGDSPRVAAMGDAIRSAGADERIAFAFDRIEKRPDTIDSHRLILWAASSEKQSDIVERLFRAYFEEGRDIGAPSVLTEIAREAGMDGTLVGELLAQDADRDLIEREDALARRMGISGVPTFIFDNKILMSGAHDSAAIAQAIDRASAAEAL